MVNPLGTITDYVYDTRGRVSSVWVGTNDSPSSGTWSPSNNASPCNMVQVTANQYDGGSVGDGTLTQVTTYVDSSSSDNRVSQYWYDWRDRLTASKDGVASSETDGDLPPLIIPNAVLVRFALFAAGAPGA